MTWGKKKQREEFSELISILTSVEYMLHIQKKVHIFLFINCDNFIKPFKWNFNCIWFIRLISFILLAVLIAVDNIDLVVMLCLKI